MIFLQDLPICTINVIWQLKNTLSLGHSAWYTSFKVYIVFSTVLFLIYQLLTPVGVAVLLRISFLYLHNFFMFHLVQVWIFNMEFLYRFNARNSIGIWILSSQVLMCNWLSVRNWDTNTWMVKMFISQFCNGSFPYFIFLIWWVFDAAVSRFFCAIYEWADII